MTANDLGLASVATEAQAQGDQLGGVIFPKDNRKTNGAQAPTDGNADGICIPKHTKSRRTKAAITGVRAAIRDLLEASHPQTVRQVFYALSVKGLVGKTETEYKMTVGRLLVDMRERGEIPFEWIVDHTRATYCPTSFLSVSDSLRWLTKRYRRSLWDDAQ